MGDLVLKGSTSGQITVTPTAVAGTNTLTLPAKTGNIITSADSGTVTGTMLASATVAQSNLATGVAGNGPAFGAYLGTNQSVATATFVLAAIDTEEFDTASCYNTTTYAFTPNVAGYYIVCGNVGFTGGAVTAPQLLFRKNGGDLKRGNNPASGNWSSVSSVVYLNGSTDYIQLYIAHVTGSTQTAQSGQSYTYFNAALVRSA